MMVCPPHSPRFEAGLAEVSAPAAPRRPLHTCCFIEHYFSRGGGAGYQAHLLNQELARRGHMVFVVTSRAPGDPRRETIGGIPVRRFVFPPLFWRPYGPSALRFFLRCARIASYLWLRRSHLAVIHVHQLREPALAAAFINRLLRKPLLVKVVCSGDAGDVHHLRSIRLRPFFDRLVREVPCAVCLNDESACEVREAFPEITVLQGFPNGVDTATYRPLGAHPTRAPLRLVFCGRLVPQKHLRTLIEAVARLKATEVVDVLRIGGDGPQRPELEALVRAYGIASKVQFLGVVTPPDLYASGDTYVSTSHAEGMPNALLEAMACGLVPVCSDIPGHRELILHGVTGLLFPRGDVPSLAACLEGLACDPDLRTRLARNARRHIEEGYSIGQTAERYEALYESLQTRSADPVQRPMRVGGLRTRGDTTAATDGRLRGWKARGKGILSRFAPPPPPPQRMSDARIHDLLAREPGGGRTLDVGSGVWRRSPNVVNLDVVAHPNVDVIGDARLLPFRSEAFDFVCCTSALEHLHYPEKAVAEIERVLRPGGRVFVEVPFVYPFHGDDATREEDYRRMTAAGLRHALREFHELETGQSVGPGSVLSLVAAEVLALFFSLPRYTGLYYSVRNLVGWLLLPLRWLDPWLARRRFAHRIAGGFYFLGVKDGAPAVPGGHRG